MIIFENVTISGGILIDVPDPGINTTFQNLNQASLQLPASLVTTPTMVGSNVSTTLDDSINIDIVQVSTMSGSNSSASLSDSIHIDIVQVGTMSGSNSATALSDSIDVTFTKTLVLYNPSTDVNIPITLGTV
jgi:hypothetical protein